MKDIPLADSPFLVPVPPVNPRKAVVLTRCTYRRLGKFPWRPDKRYSSWEQVFDENADCLDYLLMPDDYRALGSLEIDQLGGTTDRPKTIRYYDRSPGTVHPVQRPLSQARVDSFRFDGSDLSHWLLEGLTFKGPESTCVIRGGASHITVDSCLIEEGVTYSVRIRDASACTIQRCVIRDTIRTVNSGGLPGDSSGIVIGPANTDILGIRILDNEIYNVGDCIQVTRNTDDPLHPLQHVETLIEGNDLYLEPSRYLDGTDTTLDENAIDLKEGSGNPESTIIRNNRMWGFRHRAIPGSLGQIVVVQRFARNVLIENNIMGDAPIGVADFAWPQHPAVEASNPRNVTVRNNQFYEIHAYSDLDDRSAITKPITSGTLFTGNHFSRSAYIADLTPPPYWGEVAVYTGNTRVDVGGVQPIVTRDRVDYNDALNFVADAPFGYDTYERKRWTGPEHADGAIPATEP